MIHNLPTQFSSINKKIQDRESILILLVDCFRVINTYVANRQFYEKKRKIFIDKLIRCIRTSTTGYALALQIKLGKKWNISSKQEFFKQIQNFYYEYRLTQFDYWYSYLFLNIMFFSLINSNVLVQETIYNMFSSNLKLHDVASCNASLRVIVIQSLTAY